MNKMFHATLQQIREVETEHVITPHVDAGSWESWGESAVQAKTLLCDALEKRLHGAQMQLKRAHNLLDQAQALQLPD